MAPTSQCLAFFTDYGHQTISVGLLKASALSCLTPMARAWTTLLDLTHEASRAQDSVELVALALKTAGAYLPAHSVYVVDFGVKDRSFQGPHLMAWRADMDQLVIGPDTGILTPLLQTPLRASELYPEAPQWEVRRLQSVDVSPFRPFLLEAEPLDRASLLPGRDFYTPLACSWINRSVSGQEEALEWFRKTGQAL
jgi:S-adenosyl-l-methionine hydroxide adenosyltransferase